jgi:hypothetical protein
MSQELLGPTVDIQHAPFKAEPNMPRGISVTGLIAIGGACVAAIGIGAWAYFKTQQGKEIATYFPTVCGPLPRDAHISFLRGYECLQLDQRWVVVRYYGGSSHMLGHYFGVEVYETAEEARIAYALPPTNTCDCRVFFEMPIGSCICLGSVAPANWRAGGGSQVYVFDPEALTYIRSDCGFETWTYCP